MSYNILFEKALSLHNEGALNQAESLYLQILDTNPQNSDIWNLLGLIAQSKSNQKQAINSFINAIKYSPKPFAPYYFNLGISYKALGQYYNAKENFMKATDIDNNLKEAWNYLGLIYQNLGDTKNRDEPFIKAIEIDDSYIEAKTNLYFCNNNKDSLIKLLDKEEYYPNYMYAKILVAENKYKKAIKYLEIAYSLAPYYTLIILELARCYQALENNDIAIEYYYKAYNIDCNDIEAILGIADIHLIKEEFAKAEKFYKLSFNITRNIAGAYLNYGISLYKQNRVYEALEAYRSAVVLSPDTPEISYNLALILKELGEYEEALGLMFNAHQKDNTNELFSINISETLTMLFEVNAELALKIAHNWNELEPDNLFSKRILDAFTNSNKQSSRHDIQFTQKIFDNFASSYENTMENLNTQIIDTLIQKRGVLKGRVLDLGCGTGLAAQKLKNEDNLFIGVDISSKMLEIAKSKNIYDNLHCIDIVKFISKNSVKDNFDIVLALDVFCYIGNIEKLVSKLSGVELWFTIESANNDINKDYYLDSNNRYKHKEEYIFQLLQKNGFKNICNYHTVLRQENGSDVQGVIFGCNKK